jgi:hypothetical protein
MGEAMKPRIVKKDGMWHCSGMIFRGCFPFEYVYHGEGSGHSVRSAYMDWANKLVMA